MPIYEFKCEQCNKIFAELVRGDSRLTDIRCPHCNGSDVNRKMSAFGFSTGTSSAYSNASSSCSSCSSHNCSTCH